MGAISAALLQECGDAFHKYLLLVGIPAPASEM